MLPIAILFFSGPYAVSKDISLKFQVKKRGEEKKKKGWVVNAVESYHEGFFFLLFLDSQKYLIVMFPVSALQQLLA